MDLFSLIVCAKNIFDLIYSLIIVLYDQSKMNNIDIGVL